MLLFAYMFVGVQSILFATIMEWQFAHGLDPRSWQSVKLSALLGFASGLMIALVFGFSASKRIDPLFLLFWAGTGVAVGFTLGLLIKILSPERQTSTAA